MDGESWALCAYKRQNVVNYTGPFDFLFNTALLHF